MGWCSAVAVSAERGLVNDSLGGDAFGAEMFPARVAQACVFLAYYCAAVLADGTGGTVA